MATLVCGYVSVSEVPFCGHDQTTRPTHDAAVAAKAYDSVHKVQVLFPIRVLSSAMLNNVKTSIVTVILQAQSIHC